MPADGAIISIASNIHVPGCPYFALPSVGPALRSMRPAPVGNLAIAAGTASPSKEVVVQVSSPAGVLCVLCVDAFMTVGKLKVAIQERTDIPAVTQRLFHDLSELTSRTATIAAIRHGAKEEHNMEILLVREEFPVFKSFEDYDLNENLLCGIHSYGFATPIAMQQHCIKPIMLGRKIVCEAQTGMGTIATFVIGCLQRIDVCRGACQALILAPTRDRATEIQEVARALGKNQGVQCECIIGGVSQRPIIDNLRGGGQHLVVGTPPRMYGMIHRRHLRVDDVTIVVLDDFDLILSRGFKDAVSDLFGTLPLNVQVCSFSKTMPIELLDEAKKRMRNAVRLHVKKDELSDATILLAQNLDT